mgnify:CR=1 FL=1
MRLAPRLKALLPRLAPAALAILLLPAPVQALYLFYYRKDLELALASDPASVVGKQVVFTDELMVIWPDAQERPADMGGQSWVLFDTELFHCAIPRDAMGTHLSEAGENAARAYGDVLKELEAVNDEWHARKISEADAQTRRKDLYWKLLKVWSNRPLVTVFGTVARADFWGEVVGKEEGVSTERVTIVADRVERPRRRWYEEGLDVGLDREPPGMREMLDRR